MAATMHQSESAALDGDSVVISGMAGLFPQSRHIKDLADILYEKKNPISEETCRWTYSHPEVSNFTGNVPGLDRFDAQFFKVHFRLGEGMDPMSRKTLEMSYQAIYDAGVSPEQLSGKKVGVYIGSCFSESEKAFFYVASTRTTAFGLTGCSKTMFANRISYWLNLKGPSMSVDQACCSSLAALEQAYQAISRGECEAAIVGGANVCLHPQSSVHYARIIKLCHDGKQKSFDENADGCVRSEAINVLFLQKAKYAKRIYAEVVHIKNEFGKILEGETGPRYGFYRNPVDWAQFLKKFYDEAKISPKMVEYVEAFGSAVPEADRNELETIDRIFCKNRQSPLLVGSVMSNIGYGEAASGISSVIKVLLAYQRGLIPANLNCENPRRDIAALRDGKIEIVTDHKPFDGVYTAVNGISVTGVNAHVLLKGHHKAKDHTRYVSAFPHLVTISARQDTSVQRILDDLKSRPIDPEELALLRAVHQTSIPGHLGRGYTILSTNEAGATISLAEASNYFDDARRPLWFVYSGMGSQWAGMGAQLMRIPIFAEAIQRCQKVLEPKGVDLIHIITSSKKNIFDNILNSFVGIAAIQIGLTDILTALGLVPDNIIGHSVGELGCAYADGCLTAEEMILAAYSRGLVSIQTPFIRGSMAAVGLGYKQIIDLLPPEIEVACHNGPASCTISGPADIMKEFVAKLTEKNIFAKEVPCSNIAYHSSYIAEAGPGLLKYLKKVIHTPKARSERWLSTSVPQEKWNDPIAKYSSAEYHTNNLLNSVLFEETSRLVPPNAVLVEIAPHGLLQAILKRSLPESCKHVPLTRRGHPDNVFMVLDGIGKLYMEGFNSKVQDLYPTIEFPVSTGTPMLSHLVEWAHDEKWVLAIYNASSTKHAAATKNVISIHDDEHSYIKGHVIRGKNLYPFSAALVAVWDTLAMSVGAKRRQIAVEFRDVTFFAQPPVHDQRQLHLNITLQRGTGTFEVMDDNRKVAKGCILNVKENKKDFATTFNTEEQLELNSEDVYQILRSRDYNYKDEFCAIHKVNPSFTEAHIVWSDNWVTFLDGIFQLHALKDNYNSISVPYQLQRLSINIKEHFNNKFLIVDGKTVVVANVFDKDNKSRCGGVIVESIKYRKLPIFSEETTKLKTSKFVPRFLTHTEIPTSIEVYLQIVSENINKDTINVLQVSNQVNNGIFDVFREVIKEIPGLSINYKVVPIEKLLEMRDCFLNDVDVVLIQSLATDDSLCQMLYRVLPRGVFIINIENIQEKKVCERPSGLYRVVSTHIANQQSIDLGIWRSVEIATATTVVTVKSTSDLIMLMSTRRSLSQKHKLVIISPYPAVRGLKNLVKDWRRSTDHNQVYLIMVSQLQNLEQLPDLDLAYNVLNNGVWGGEYFLSCQQQVLINRCLRLTSGKIGDLDTLQWVEKEESSESGIGVTVHYAAINNVDVKRATGEISFLDCDDLSQISYGMDFSGVTESGERVMGILPSGAVSSRVVARPDMLWPVPDHWSLEDAVTVPSAYVQAFYCYIHQMKISVRQGFRILVHGGAGALGQAAINIALGIGCEVFTTVSDMQKKRFLLDLFPGLQEDHVGNSRDPSFGDVVLNRTKGEGCNIVFCGAQGEIKNVLLKMCGFLGVMLDTSRLTDQEDFNLGMNHLSNERSYVHLDYRSLFAKGTVNNNKEIIETLRLMVSEGIAKGYVRPLSRVTYAPLDVARAFRLMTASRHCGRVTLSMMDSSFKAHPRLFCSQDFCHIVIYDEDFLGVQFADRLVSRGAMKLHLHTQNVSANLRIRKKQWENRGVKVTISAENLSESKNTAVLVGVCSRIGPIEGVYVLTGKVTEAEQEKIAGIVANLDWTTRQLQTPLRYFAVVSAGATIGQQTCLARARDGLPAAAVNLLPGKKIKDETSRHNAVDAIEQAIRSCQPSLLALTQKKEQQSLLQQISKIAEIDLSELKADKVSLRDLNIAMTRVPIIQHYLCDVHNVFLGDEEILDLTLEKIHDLSKVICGTETKAVRGLETFFSYVDPDELLATADLVFLPTLMSSAAMMRDDDFDVSKTYLCLIPGMEGHHGRFRELCERLKIPAIVLQPGLDLLNETVRETAERYVKILLKKVKVTGHFYLLGYEFGVLIALEVAAILEEHGMTGTVYLIGGTPEELKHTLAEQLSGFESDEKLQDEVAKYMFSLMTGDDSKEFEVQMDKFTTRNERVDAYVRTLLGKVSHSAQYARAWIQAPYLRIVQMRSYKPQIRQLKSKLILMQASLNSDSTIDSVTASLQRYSKQPVVVYQLQTPLANVAYDLRCGAIVNRHLEEDIQQAYYESNLCETYLVNPNTFMSTSVV